MWTLARSDFSRRYKKKKKKKPIRYAIVAEYALFVLNVFPINI